MRSCACVCTRVHTYMHTAVLTCMDLSAVNEAKRDWASGKTRDIYACMIAEVTTENGQNGHDGPGSSSQAVFVSPELYVCSERNLRKQCTPARRL